MAYATDFRIIGGRKLMHDPATKETYFNGRWYCDINERGELINAVRKANELKDEADAARLDEQRDNRLTEGA
jgi:hypothetical protein